MPGYFTKGSRGPVIARASTGRADTAEGTLRTSGIAGTLYPKLDERHEDLLNPAHFFVQDTLSGTRFARIADVAMANAPSVRLLDNLGDASRTFRPGPDLRDVDDETAVRDATNAPQFMRLTVPDQSSYVDADVRDEVLAHIYDRGDRTPRRSLVFDIAVANEGRRVGDLVTGREFVVTDWQTIGRLTFENAVVSCNGDFVLHFHRPPFRRIGTTRRPPSAWTGRRPEDAQKSACTLTFTKRAGTMLVGTRQPEILEFVYVAFSVSTALVLSAL